MQPWVGKGTGSSSNSSTLHYDRTLSHLQQQQHNSYQQPQSFRTTSSSSSAYQQQQKDQQSTINRPSMISEFAPYQHTPISHLAPHEDMADGTEVLEFLNSSDYNDLVHGDDLRPDSISYISYRHQQDTQHALSEKEKLQKHWTAELLGAEDIVEYLLKETYTEDIYGIPILGQYIKEAKEELQDNSQSKKVAVERLTMIRNHLIQKHNNNVNSATNQIFEMNENDWSSFF